MAIIGLSVVAIPAALALSSGAGAGSVSKRSYIGTFGGKSRVVIRVDYKQGEPKGGTFKPKRFEVLCDDQTRPRESFTIPIRIRFTSRKHFTGQFYRAEPRSWAQSYTRVEGHLASDGRRARGYMLRIEDPSDPPGTENAPECGTFGRSHWHAKRVGSRR